MDLVYEVITPQTLLKYKVKCLSYGDELKLQSAILATEETITDHFNQTLFNSLETKPKEIQSYDDFLTKTTISDRLALVAGLYHVSYGDEYVVDTVCPLCGKTNSSKVELTKFANVKFYEGKPMEILDKQIQVETDGNVWTLKFPVLKKEMDVTKAGTTYEIEGTLSNLLLYVDNVKTPEGKILDLSNPLDFITYIKIQPSRHIKQVRKTITNEINKYNFEIPFKVKCPSCKNIYSKNIDFVEQFLRQVLEA